jgi:DNA-directed RNA polymerase subunit E'/Rpb7
MATTTQRNYKPRQEQKKNDYSVYVRNLISSKVHLKMSEIGDATKQNLENKIKRRIEGKCIPEGFVEPRTIKIVTYSSGVVKMNLVEFQVVFECSICNPVEGQIVECTTKTITKAGIHAEVLTGQIVPMKVFIARDHNYANRFFGSIKENEQIQVRIIGKRFELNDPYIVAIASLIESKKARGDFNKTPQNKPRIKVLEDTALNREEIEEGEGEEVEYDEEEQEPEYGDEAIAAPISIPTLRQDSQEEEGEVVEERRRADTPEDGEVEE